MNWIQVTIFTSAEGIEPVTGRLYQLGVTGTEIEDENEFNDFLENNRQYWDYVDENLRKKMSGEIGLCIFFILLVIYNFIKGLSVYDLLAIFWGYLGVSYIYKYRAFKTKKSLITAVCGIIAAVGFLLSYVLQTW